MAKHLEIFACLAASLAIAPAAGAANRAYSSRSAVLDNPNDAPCFTHAPGDPTLKNICGTRANVFLPMSVDAAAWCTVSIHGRGWITSTGAHNSIACIANGLPHDASTLWGNGWVGLPNTGAFGGAQTMSLNSVPVFSPGDAVYAYCVLDPNTTLFTYGWN
jgi:hypothetical protein